MLGLEKYDGAPVDEAGRNSQGASDLVELAVEERATCADCGRLYDGDWKDYNTGLFLCLKWLCCEKQY
jgi:hypothetical protein